MTALALVLALGAGAGPAAWRHTPDTKDPSTGKPVVTKALLDGIAKERLQSVGPTLDRLTEIHELLAARKPLEPLPDALVAGLVAEARGHQERLVAFLAGEQPWRAALPRGKGSLDAYARVAIDTDDWQLPQALVQAHVMGSPARPTIELTLEPEPREYDPRLTNNPPYSLGAAGSVPDKYRRVRAAQHPHPALTVRGVVAEDGTFVAEQWKDPNAAQREGELAIAGRIRPDGQMELTGLRRQGHGLDYGAARPAVGSFEQTGQTVLHRPAKDLSAATAATRGPLGTSQLAIDDDYWRDAHKYHIIQHKLGTAWLNGVEDEYISLYRKGSGFVAEGSDKQLLNTPLDTNKMGVGSRARAAELMVARGAEAEAQSLAAEHFGAAPLPAEAISDATAPLWARLAQIAGKLDTVQIEHLGATIALSDHPAIFRGKRDGPADEQFLNQSLAAIGAEVGASNRATDAQAQASAGRAQAAIGGLLLGGPGFHFHELIDNLIAARELWGSKPDPVTGGRMARGFAEPDAPGTPWAFTNRSAAGTLVEKLLAAYRSPGATAVLVGLTTRVPRAVLEAKLRASIDAPTAELWGQIAEDLQTLPGSLVAYALRDLKADPTRNHLDPIVLFTRLRAAHALVAIAEGSPLAPPLRALAQSARGSHAIAALGRALVDYAPVFAATPAYPQLVELFRDGAYDLNARGKFFPQEFAR